MKLSDFEGVSDLHSRRVDLLTRIDRLRHGRVVVIDGVGYDGAMRDAVVPPAVAVLERRLAEVDTGLKALGVAVDA